jgi:hypothetical protein
VGRPPDNLPQPPRRRCRKWLPAAWLVPIGLLLPLSADTGPLAAPTPRAGKKLIEWGWDEPDPTFMTKHDALMDATGFDGVVFHLNPVHDGRMVNFSREGWSEKAFSYADFANPIADLKACHFSHLTENFVHLNVNDVDWFDEHAYLTVANNMRLLARIARETGARGIMLDVESYGSPLWCYGQQHNAAAITYPQYKAMVRRRGEQFVRSLDAEYPEITILLTYGYTVRANDPVVDRSWGTYGLLEDFLDGMFEAASPNTVIVDAFELAYSFRKRSEFVNAYHYIHDKMLTVTSVPDAYKRHVSAAFGVWMDSRWPALGWHTDDLQRNYFTPEEFAYSVSSALQVSDKYVWVYSEQPRWWTQQDVPAEYRAALRLARHAYPDDDAHVGLRVLPPAAASAGSVDRAPLAARQDGSPGDAQADEGTFPLSTNWTFRADPKEEGVAQGWFRPGAPAGEWRDIRVGQFWDQGGVPYTGTAWYRADWTAPPFTVPPGGRILLWFGAAADRASVWINGKWAGSHDPVADTDWARPFSIPVTHLLEPGQRNSIAVQVRSRTTLGGLWRPLWVTVQR